MTPLMTSLLQELAHDARHNQIRSIREQGNT
jgi:hypothetical protein